eukprot:g2469.t1
MPIVKRSIFHAQCYASPDLYADTTPDSALVDVNMARMTGVLHQLGFLSTYATEMFDDLFKMAKGVTDRTKKVSVRVKEAQEQLPGMEQWLNGAPARDDAGGPVFHVPSGKLERDDQAEMQQFQQQFTPESRPNPIRMRFAECDPPPALSSLDEYVSDGPCLKKFSNPQFFFDEWIREETKRQEKLADERAERKRQRRARREREKREGTRRKTHAGRASHALPQVTGWREQARAVAGGSSARASAAPPDTPFSKAQPVAVAATPSHPPATAVAQAVTQPAQVEASELPPPPPPPPDEPASALQDAAQIEISQTIANPSAAAGAAAAAAAAAAMEPEASELPPPPPPPPADTFAAANSADAGLAEYSDVAMPLPATACTPEPAPAPPPKAAPKPKPVPVVSELAKVRLGGGGGGMSILDQIKKGKKLKKAAPVTPKPLDARDNLLAQIKKKKQLKHVDREQVQAAKKPDKPSNDIAAILQRRIAIAADSESGSSSSDEDDEDEWDDD